VEGRVVGAIGPGLLCLVGLCRGDTTDDAKWITNKILGTKLFAKPAGDGPDTPVAQWKASVKDMSGEVLLVSQFTLFALCKVGDFKCSRM
jgi:D-aminoacyl-tRNA deacylase